jgi:purine nucleosidase
MKTKILLDTDIGTDIDDAVCLAYLLLHPECDLLGITTVTGQAVQRAMLASLICKAAGRSIPIFPGAENPMVVPQRQKIAAQAEVLARWDHKTQFPNGEAVEFLRSTIRQHPGEVVLLTIAPLTNIGLLFAVDPEIPSLLKALVMMCGRFAEDVPAYGPIEWNAMADPHATAIVYRAPVPVHRSVGLDVTTRVAMTADEFRHAYQHPIFVPIYEMAEIWFRDWKGTTFHDPLAAATIFNHRVCTFHRGTVTAEVDDSSARGRTFWIPDERGGPHEVALEVNPELFFHDYRSVLA